MTDYRQGDGNVYIWKSKYPANYRVLNEVAKIGISKYV